MPENNRISNFLTIDVEDYFQIHAFANAIKPADWDNFKCQVESNVDVILNLLDRGDIDGNMIKATFFVLGWIAEKYPEVIKKIHHFGHEIASHGYGHQVIYQQSKREFREDIKRSKQILENLTGEQVFGYRAPTYSITEKTLWALYILKEEGYLYDSSIFPIRHDNYGMVSCPRFPFVWDLSRGQPTKKDFSIAKFKNLEKAGLIEFPISTVKLLHNNFPCSGGGYFRLFPYNFIRMCLNRINREGKPFVFYLHPWELNPNIPKVENISFLSKFRTYVNLSKTEMRFRRLLKDFKFVPFISCLEKNLLSHQ